MTKIYLPIPIPKFIESIVVYFLLRYRKKRFGFAFRRIKLTQGQYAKVDPEDFKYLNLFKWYANKSRGGFYARRVIYIDGKIKVIHMHRLVMNYDGELCIDHKNQNSLDNRKANLRIATAAENRVNSPRNVSKSSKYRGVCLKKELNKWQASIGYEGKHIHLGYFDNEEDAAKAYDEAARKYYGEYAVLNFESREAVEQLIVKN